MASLFSSPFFISILLLISFAFHSFFLIKSHAFEERKAMVSSHFHTVEISSLLPTSVCSSSRKGPKKKPSTLEVVHRHGPCSKHSQDKATPSLHEVLSSDQSRVDSIQSKLNPGVDTEKIKDKKATLPAQSGRSLGSGNYIVILGLGTPTKSLSLIFDTGSDLTWTQCKPCARSCYQQQDPIFDPTGSTSYSNVSCSAAQCSQLSSATGNDPGCSTSTKTCIYGIQYGDQSFSVGFFSRETLTITSSDVVPNFYFGCGQNNQGLFGNTAGLLGLGRDSLSFVSQTAQKYGKYFSYCLPGTSSSTGHLTFGNSGGSGNVKFTPFAASQSSSFYFINIIGISVGATQLSVSPSVFKTAGTIIDSGTVITRLPPAAYSALSAEFKKQMSKYTSAPAYSILDTCYDISKYTTITIPKIGITFDGNVKVDIAASGILIAVSSGRVCLAFAGNKDASDVGIFGNVQQKTLEVVYDVAGGKLGFGPGGC